MVRVAPQATVMFPVNVRSLSQSVFTATVLSEPIAKGESEAVRNSSTQTNVRVVRMIYRPGGAISNQGLDATLNTEEWWARPDLNRGLTAPSRQV